jgi:RNA-binding protein 27
MMGKPQTPGAYVLNKVPVKHRLGHASGNQSDVSHLLNQSGGAGEDCQVCISVSLINRFRDIQ